MLDMSHLPRVRSLAAAYTAIRILPFVALAAVAACASPSAQAGDPPPPPVTAARALSRTVTEWNEFTGRLEAVESVDAALRSFSKSRPDIIITDIFFAGGGGDGFALIERVRAQDPDLPIIAISGGRAGFDVLAQAAKLGANATIEKPFSAAYLVDTIDRCLEARVSGA